MDLHDRTTALLATPDTAEDLSRVEQWRLVAWLLEAKALLREATGQH